jgi:hypothetical protein
VAEEKDPVSESLETLAEIDSTLSRRAIAGDRMPTGGLWGRFCGALALAVGYTIAKFYPFLGPIAFPAILAVLGTTAGNLYWRLKVHAAEVKLETLRSGLRVLEGEARRCLGPGAPEDAQRIWWQSFEQLVGAIADIVPTHARKLSKQLGAGKSRASSKNLIVAAAVREDGLDRS